MANIRKRGGRWQAQVRRSGYQPLVRSFGSHQEAQTWSRQQETRIDRGDDPMPITELKRVRLDDLLIRYEAEVTPRKRSAPKEVYL